MRTLRSSLRWVSGLSVIGLLLGSGCSHEPTAPQDVGPITLQIVSGGGQSGAVGAELPQPLVIKAKSATGTPIPFFTVNFEVTSGGGSMFADVVTTDAHGVAADYWTLGTVAAQPQKVEVRAVLPDGQKQVYGVFAATALPGPASQIAVSAGDKDSALANTAVAIPPSVIVHDQFNNPVSGVAVTFAVATGGGSITGGGQTTNTAGIATVGSWTLGALPGANTLTAAATGSGITGNPVTFTATGVPMGLTFATISTGASHSCGLSPAGAAFCWGANGVGQIGDGTTTERLIPTAVLGDLTFVSITTGDSHNCGLTKAGAAFCWGSNFVGQVGNGTTTNGLTPGAVAGGLTFTSITAGETHECGLTPAGAAYCWGSNYYGNLGDGTTNDQLTPVAVLGGLQFASISASSTHTCALTSAGAAYCWGWNGGGGLGDGTTTTRLTPGAVSGGLTFTSITAGAGYTCGLTSVGAAYCWGDNSLGGLGTGVATGSLTPVPVTGGLTFAEVSAGSYHTCALTPSGAAYCWGDDSGEIGDGTQTYGVVLSPVAVSGGLRFTSISVGFYARTCAVAVNGQAYCWGYAPVGDGTESQRLTPTLVAQP